MSEDYAPGRGQAVLVRGRLEEPLSRWLWLVKWLLLIPHYIVLAFLWVAFTVVTVVAFFAILFTARYPRGLFAFNLGVLRWSWRVSYYGYSALATDRYPPFSLSEEPDYPATLDIAYPQRLSRGLVLVKWWLLALPQYLVLGFVVGGGTWTVTSATGNSTSWTVASWGLLALLVLFAGVALLFTTVYPRGLYDLVTGLNRWVMRVVAYAALMTDGYPPFRLDQGGSDPASPDGPTPAGPTATALEPPVTRGAVPGEPRAHGGGRRTGGIIALIAGVLALLAAVTLTAVGAGGLWLNSRRDAAGFVSTGTRVLASPTAAITAEGIDLRLGNGAEAWVASDRFGTLRVRATGLGGTPVFLGVAPQAALDTWLAGVAHDEVNNISSDTITYRRQGGGAVAPSPVRQTFWAASVSGSGTQELRWPIQNGRWAVVLARPDGAPGVQARTDVGANIPGLQGLATGVLVLGIVLLLGGIALIVIGATALGRSTGRSGSRAPSGPRPPVPPQPRDPTSAEPAPSPGPAVGTTTGTED